MEMIFCGVWYIGGGACGFTPRAANQPVAPAPNSVLNIHIYKFSNLSKKDVKFQFGIQSSSMKEYCLRRRFAHENEICPTQRTVPLLLMLLVQRLRRTPALVP
jgi:hypothetical protein